MPTSVAIAEDLLDPARLVVEAEDDLVDVGHLLQQIDLVLEERPVEDRERSASGCAASAVAGACLCRRRAGWPS